MNYKLCYRVIIFIILCLIGYLLYESIGKTKEHFDVKDTINTLLQKAKNEMKKSKKWKSYIAIKDFDKYTLKLDNLTFSSIGIKNMKDKIIYTVYDKNNKEIGIKGYKDKNSMELKINDKNGTITYNKGKQRSVITIKANNETENDETIVGYGGFPGEIVSIKKPWYDMIPIIYEDSGTIIAFMDKNNDITINVSDDKYLNLFFLNYVFLYEHIFKTKSS